MALSHASRDAGITSSSANSTTGVGVGSGVGSTVGSGVGVTSASVTSAVSSTVAVVSTALDCPHPPIKRSDVRVRVVINEKSNPPAMLGRME